jgi:hypothetical protein
MGLLKWWRAWRLERRVRKGKQTWGRQGQGPQEPGAMPTTMKGRATFKARVYRAATDTWEDLGVIAETDFGKEK